MDGDPGTRLWRAEVALDSLGNRLIRPPDCNRVSGLLGSHRPADMDLVSPLTSLNQSRAYQGQYRRFAFAGPKDGQQDPVSRLVSAGT